jgi:hypothetical protein
MYEMKRSEPVVREILGDAYAVNEEEVRSRLSSGAGPRMSTSARLG